MTCVTPMQRGAARTPGAPVERVSSIGSWQVLRRRVVTAEADRFRVGDCTCSYTLLSPSLSLDGDSRADGNTH